MAFIGCLGNIVFSVSSRTVQTFDNMSWNGSARISEHKRHMANALTEFTGVDADTISFEMTLSMYLGSDPMAEIVKLWGYERSGRAVPLVIGSKGYGKYRWLVKSHKTKMQTFDKRGNLTGATVTVNLVEYLSA